MSNTCAHVPTSASTRAAHRTQCDPLNQLSLLIPETNHASSKLKCLRPDKRGEHALLPCLAPHGLGRWGATTTTLAGWQAGVHRNGSSACPCCRLHTTKGWPLDWTFFDLSSPSLLRSGPAFCFIVSRAPNTLPVEGCSLSVEHFLPVARDVALTHSFDLNPYSSSLGADAITPSFSHLCSSPRCTRASRARSILCQYPTISALFQSSA